MWTIRPTRRQSCRGHPRKTPGRRAITDRSEPFGAIFRGRCRLPGHEQAIAPFEAVAERSSAVLERPAGSRSTSQHVHIGISSAFDRAHRSRIEAASGPHRDRTQAAPEPRPQSAPPKQRHAASGHNRAAGARGGGARLHPAPPPPSRRPPSRQPHPNRFKMRRETTNRTRARAAAPRSARRPWAARRSMAPPTEETERRWEPSAISASWT